MSDSDVVIKGGMIVDGTGAPRYRNDLAVKDGRIVDIGKIDGGRADRVIDAGDRVEAIPYAAMEEASPWGWESSPEFLDKSPELLKKLLPLRPGQRRGDDRGRQADPRPGGSVAPWRQGGRPAVSSRLTPGGIDPEWKLIVN